MLLTKVPKDIRVYKTKLIGPLTLRQFICLLIAAAIDVLLYFQVIDRFGLSLDAAIYIFIILDTLIFSFTVEIMGIPMEKYLKVFFRDNFIAPTRRLPKTVFFSADEPVQATGKEKRKQKKRLKKNLKAHPELKAYK